MQFFAFYANNGAENLEISKKSSKFAVDLGKAPHFGLLKEKNQDKPFCPAVALARLRVAAANASA